MKNCILCFITHTAQIYTNADNASDVFSISLHYSQYKIQTHRISKANRIQQNANVYTYFFHSNAISLCRLSIFIQFQFAYEPRMCTCVYCKNSIRKRRTIDIFWIQCLSRKSGKRAFARLLARHICNIMAKR